MDPAQPNRDSFARSQDVPLTSDWQQLEIVLGVEPSAAISAFALVFHPNQVVDPATLGPSTVYLDDIVYE